MVNLPKGKIGIVTCGGEELPEGTVSRVATSLVLERLRPGQTVTLCLPLLLTGAEEERTFVEFYPTIAVDGCGKRCAARAIEAQGARPAAAVVASEVATRFPHLKAESRRHLGDGGMELARRVAEEVVARVDGISARPAMAGLTRPDAAPSRRRQTAAVGCTCGLDGMPVKTIRMGGGLVGIAGLERIFEQMLPASSDGTANDKLKAELLQVVKIYNYIPPGHDEAYADALWNEFLEYRAKGRPERAAR